MHVDGWKLGTLIGRHSDHFLEPWIPFQVY